MTLHLNAYSINFPWYSSTYGEQGLTLREELNSTTDNRVMDTDTHRLNVTKDKLYCCSLKVIYTVKSPLSGENCVWDNWRLMKMNYCFSWIQCATSDISSWCPRFPGGLLAHGVISSLRGPSSNLALELRGSYRHKSMLQLLPINYTTSMHSHLYLALSEEAAFPMLDKNCRDNEKWPSVFLNVCQLCESNTAVGSQSVSQLTITHKKMCVEIAVGLKVQHQHSVRETVALKLKH